MISEILCSFMIFLFLLFCVILRFFFQIIAEEEPESPPLNYELDMAAALASATSVSAVSATVSADLSGNAKSPTNDLESQERRTRIALLENQQAELETEIRLLKQCGKFYSYFLYKCKKSRVLKYLVFSRKLRPKLKF